MLTAGKLKQNSFLNYYVISDIQYLLSHTYTHVIFVYVICIFMPIGTYCIYIYTVNA